jgi:hypothetical protein
MLSKVQLSRVQLVAARWGEQGLEREEQNETQPVVVGGGVRTSNAVGVPVGGLSVVRVDRVLHS